MRENYMGMGIDREAAMAGESYGNDDLDPDGDEVGTEDSEGEECPLLSAIHHRLTDVLSTVVLPPHENALNDLEILYHTIYGLEEDRKMWHSLALQWESDARFYRQLLEEMISVQGLRLGSGSLDLELSGNRGDVRKAIIKALNAKNVELTAAAKQE